jgi:predicted ArsR family transcriptional regulator
VPRRVGRAPKAYEPSPHPIEVSLPPRRHELLASLLAEAVVDQRPGEDSQGAALRAARLRGEAMGSRDAAVPSGAGDPLACALAALERLGFEPETLAEPGSATVAVLRNCPFHPVAAQAPALVCGMNHAFVEGYLTGLGATTATAVLNPRPGSCCVELRTKEVGAAARATRPPRVACDREST